MSNFKDKFVYFIDRRKHNAKSNLKLISVLLFIVMIVGVFFPLLTLKGSVNLKNNIFEDFNIDIFNPKSNIIEVSSYDFISGKDLPEYKILDKEIGKVSVGNVVIYDFITSPMPELKWLKKTNETLNSGLIDFLVSDAFVDICDNYLGDFGKGLKDIGKSINKLSESTSDVLDEIIGVSNELNKASQDVNRTLDNIESAIDIIDIIFIVLFILPVVSIILLIIGKGPKKLPAILLTIFTAIFILLGIGMLIGNNILNIEVMNATKSINEAIERLIYSLVPDFKDLLSSTGLASSMVFDIKSSLNIGSGYYLITIPSVILTVLAYIIPSLNKPKKLVKKTK